MSLSAPSIAIGNNAPRPRNSACCLSLNLSAQSLMSPSSVNASSIRPGISISRLTSWCSRSRVMPWCLASATTSMPSAASWVVNALVEATPISGPARVSITSSDSRTRELSGALQMASADR